jgi:hypothetical protein
MKCTCQSTLAPDPRCFIHGEPTLVKRLYWSGRLCLELIAQILRMAWGLIESSFLKLIAIALIRPVRDAANSTPEVRSD